MKTTLRQPTPADAPALGRLIFDAFGHIAARHGMPLDFPALEMAIGLAEFMTHHPKLNGRVVETDGKIVGCNFLWRRNTIGGIGPVCVDPAAQSRGIGRQLMEWCVDAGKDMRGLRLVQDAFNATSMSLYTSVGFDVREPLGVMRGKLTAPAPTDAVTRPLTENDLPACGDLCDRVHGFDRNEELKDAMMMLRPHVLERNGNVVAYAASPWMWHLNHGVAETEQDMMDLLAGISASSPDPITMLIPTRQSTLFRWLLSKGARIQKPMTLMSRGWYEEPKGTWYPSVEY